MPISGAQTDPLSPLRVRLASLSREHLSFIRPFRIGRSDDCDVCIKDEHISRVHAEVVFENGSWWIRDLNSSNGLYLDGRRVQSAPLTQRTVMRLGIEGPQLTFEPEGSSASASAATSEPPLEKMKHSSGTVLRRYVEHYFSKSAESAPASEHTLYVRRAFAKVQAQQKRRSQLVIATALLVALGAGGYALYEWRQLERQRALAETLFYTMKSVDLDIAALETATAASGDQQAAATVRQYEGRRRAMQNDYDQYLAALHVYNRKLTEQQRITLRIARIFGECELDMPPDFEAEINKYINYWRQSDRLANAIHRAQQNGYVELISREMLDQGLPPQFFYLALQESNFDPYASGPMTRKGIAKGMWQFVPETAIKYGLRIGPLADLRRPDPGDERDQQEKATKAAARYLKELYTTDAQASGFLVMACYNWGEDQVLPLVRSMPPNPRQRNFWRLLALHRNAIPRETYDYVFYIVSAAVIGENPRLFGFDFDNPLAELESENISTGPQITERSSLASFVE